MALLRFLATDLGILFTGFLAIAMIIAWDWRVSLIGLVLIQVGVAGLALVRQSIEPQWVTVQTFTIVLCALILALSVTQVAASPTSRQAGNWPLRLMIVILFYVSWRLFQFEVPIPLIESDLSLLFTWLSLCALLMLAISDNPLFTGSALLLWFIPMHVVTSALFPFTSLIVLFGILELVLALCCSYLILAERLGTQTEQVIVTDMTFAVNDDARLLPSFSTAPQSGATATTGDRTTANLRAVSMTERTLPIERPLTGITGTWPSIPAPEKPSDRTGEHPLVATLSRGKRGRRATPPADEP